MVLSFLNENSNFFLHFFYSLFLRNSCNFLPQFLYTSSNHFIVRYSLENWNSLFTGYPLCYRSLAYCYICIYKLFYFFFSPKSFEFYIFFYWFFSIHDLGFKIIFFFSFLNCVHMLLAHKFLCNGWSRGVKTVVRQHEMQNNDYIFVQKFEWKIRFIYKFLNIIFFFEIKDRMQKYFLCVFNSWF